MTLLENFIDIYFDTWFYAYTDKHTEKSFIKIVGIEEYTTKKRKKKYIKIFSYYPKTNRINYYKIDDVDLLNIIEFIDDLDDDTEENLNALYAKELLTQN